MQQLLLQLVLQMMELTQERQDPKQQQLQALGA
jgi:hypothetical protein